MPVRVATYNLYLGADLSLLFGIPAERRRDAVDEVLRQLATTDFPARARAIARLLTSEDVDLVGVQELTTWSRDGAVVCDFAAELVAAFDEVDAPMDLRAVNANFSGSGEGLTVTAANAVLVRRSRDVVAVDERTGTFAASFAVPTLGGDVRIARSFGWVDARVRGDLVRFVNTHTEAYDAATRDTQRDQLLAEVGEPGLPVVVVGDFNATPAHVGIPAPYVDAWTAAGGDPLGGCTYGHAADLSNPTAVMVDRIDYVWVRDAGVAGCVVRGTDPADRTPGGLWPSDHACVVAELVLGR